MDDVKLANRRVVAVDGGTATGKGRLVDELAQLLRTKGVPALHLSSGSLYRAVTFTALEFVRQRPGAELTDEAVARVRELDEGQFLQLAVERRLEMHHGVVWLDGGPVGVEEQLKSPGVGAAIPYVASFLGVRTLVNQITRRQINEFDGFLLIDGRDIAHVVVPDAPLKLFLTVAPHVAAARSIEHTAVEIVARDEADRAHRHGALLPVNKVAPDVAVIATDDHTPEMTRDHVYNLMRGVWGELPQL